MPSEMLELSKQIITKRLNWLEFKSIKVGSRGEDINITFDASRAYSDDALAQIFQTGLVEWVDTGQVSYNIGDKIDQNHIQLTILVWKDLKGEIHPTYTPQNKRYTLVFYPDSLDVADSMTMDKFHSTEPGYHTLCLVRDEIVFSCSQIMLPVPEGCSSDAPWNCEPVLNGTANVPIPPGYDLRQVRILASQMETGPLPVKFSVTQR